MARSWARASAIPDPSAAAAPSSKSSRATTTNDDAALARAASPPGDSRDRSAPEDFESPGAWKPTFMTSLPIECRIPRALRARSERRERRERVITRGRLDAVAVVTHAADSGDVQLPFCGCTLPLTVSWLPLAKLLLSPPAILEVVSKQVAPVPRLPDWKLLPSATVKSIGLLQRPEQGVARVVARQSDRHCDSPSPGPPWNPFPI